MSGLRSILRAYVAEQINLPGEHKKSVLAVDFLDTHQDLAREYMRELAEKSIASLIKELCDEPEADPLPIFSGFPAVLAVSPGVVKAIVNCTLDDLTAGLEYRRDNVRNAQDRLRAYSESMARFELLASDKDETVGQCTERIRLQGPVA